MKTYILVDNVNLVAYDSISANDARAYIESNFNIIVPHTDSIENTYEVDGGFVDVVFIDDVPSDKYKMREGSFSDISTFMAYDARFDGIEPDMREFEDIETSEEYFESQNAFDDE